MKTDYAEKLKDPRWQKKRLEVLERAGWECEWCGNGKLTLHVHHLRYAAEPWEAKDEDLECLCAYCHKFREEFNLVFPALKHWQTKTVFAFLDYMNCVKDMNDEDYARVDHLLQRAQTAHAPQMETLRKARIQRVLAAPIAVCQ